MGDQVLVNVSKIVRSDAHSECDLGRGWSFVAWLRVIEDSWEITKALDRGSQNETGVDKFRPVLLNNRIEQLLVRFCLFGGHHGTD